MEYCHWSESLSLLLQEEHRDVLSYSLSINNPWKSTMPTRNQMLTRSRTCQTTLHRTPAWQWRRNKSEHDPPPRMGLEMVKLSSPSLLLPTPRAHSPHTHQTLSYSLRCWHQKDALCGIQQNLKNCFSTYSWPNQQWEFYWNSIATTYAEMLKLHEANRFCFVLGRLMRLTEQEWYRCLRRVPQCIW